MKKKCLQRSWRGGTRFFNDVIIGMPLTVFLLQETSEEAADFEKAIESTGYGKFNYLLLLIAMPCCFSSVFETTTMSLILPSAECDLKLSLVDKGVLNAITYAGEYLQCSWGQRLILQMCLYFDYIHPRNDKLSFYVGISGRCFGSKKTPRLRLSSRRSLQHLLCTKSIVCGYFGIQICWRFYVSTNWRCFDPWPFKNCTSCWFGECSSMKTSLGDFGT
jgi:hypothetical protein